MRTLILFCGCLLGQVVSLSAGSWLRAGVCVRLVGVVQDFSTHKPLAASLSARSVTGRQVLGTSDEGTGQFAVDIACTATALLIERTGYRPQRLPLNLATITPTADVYVVIPLVAVDRQGTDRPYLQTEQKHYVQPAGTNASGQVQHSTFAVTDALAQSPLRAQVCLFFTKTGKKTCLDTDATGQCSMDFRDKDIVAIEVKSAGYQTYEGNISVEQLGGPDLHHTVRLLRELVLLSVQSSPVQTGVSLRAVLRNGGKQAPILLASVADRPGTFAAADLRPNRYELLLLDQKEAVLHRQTLTIAPGLNVQTITLPEKATTRPKTPVVASPVRPASVTATPAIVGEVPAAAPVLTDNLPTLFFDEGSYALSDATRATLQQLAVYLQQHPDVHLRLVGHTDRLGDEQLNKYLGEFRAKVAANYLHWQGVDDRRLQVMGYGSRFLVGADSTAESRRRNRRVTLKLIPARPLAETPTTSN
ncbi:OmpA family protein [Fibrella sp. HMF5335]|uniref:OmpA family protein n=1 Tax=Fibrella rubiginis TaxID=2817060 RepID=A0A939GH54_9BACT|nr:OmpA family protein [Fibrella rubiginis]MBO0936705.1 OmpA family protein [Fibrella rubiginis]